MPTDEYEKVNRRAWQQLNNVGCEWTIPVSDSDLANAKEILDPYGWFPWDRLSRVLCLAAGGGQQGPLFAHLGLKVTVLDLSPAQLERDRAAAARFGLEIELVEGSMENLGALAGRQFDLVYQPVSAVYVPDVRRVYRGVYQLLAANGLYRVCHWNPIYTQLPEDDAWDGSGYRLVYPQTMRNQPIVQHWRQVGSERVPSVSWEFIHPLDELIGGLCDQGFVIARFREDAPAHLTGQPGSEEHLAAFVPRRFAILAAKDR